MKKNCYLLLVGLVTLLSCNTNNTDVEKDEEALLTKGWKLYSQGEVTYPSGKTHEVLLPDCYKDNTYKFYLDGTYSVIGGPVKCSGNEGKPVNSDDAEPNVLISAHKWNVRKEYQGLNDMGLQQLVSVSSNTLVTRTDFSGRPPFILTYKSIK